MPITVPYSLALGANEDAKAAVPGNDTSLIPGKMKIFILDNANPKRMQSIVGSLRSVFKCAMSERFRAADNATALAGFGPWNHATCGNVTINSDGAGITLDDVGIQLPTDFAGAGATHMYQETFDQLINVLLEKTKDN